MPNDDLKVTWDKSELRELNRYLNKIEKNLGSIRPVAQFAVGKAAKSTIENFRLQGRSPFTWPELSESTIEARTRKRTWPGLILEEFGTLKQSLQPGASGPGSYLRVSRKEAEYGTTLVKARTLQFGYPPNNLPSRSFLYWRQEDIDDIMSFAFVFAYQPDKARSFSGRPEVRGIPQSLFRGFG